MLGEIIDQSASITPIYLTLENSGIRLINNTLPQSAPQAILRRCDGPDNAPFQLLLAHGAGAGMDHPFMQTIADGLAQQGIRVIRFEFPYMQKRRADGGRRPPDRMPKLLEAFAEQIHQLRTELAPSTSIFIGGKSMGGRVASLLAADPKLQSAIAGVVCLGFPFHPPGKPERYRGEHLSNLQTPLLILQGERDTFGCRDEVQQFSLSPEIECHFLNDGDHSFKPRKRSGYTLEQNLNEVIAQMERFIKKIVRI